MIVSGERQNHVRLIKPIGCRLRPHVDDFIGIKTKNAAQQVSKHPFLRQTNHSRGSQIVASVGFFNGVITAFAHQPHADLLNIGIVGLGLHPKDGMAYKVFFCAQKQVCHFPRHQVNGIVLLGIEISAPVQGVVRQHTVFFFAAVSHKNRNVTARMVQAIGVKLRFVLHFSAAADVARGIHKSAQLRLVPLAAVFADHFQGGAILHDSEARLLIFNFDSQDV